MVKKADALSAEYVVTAHVPYNPGGTRKVNIYFAGGLKMAAMYLTAEKTLKKSAK
jgi:hypothetical protein